MLYLVGGYGSVGRVVAEQLSVHFPGKVIISGRNLRKAQDLATELGNTVIPTAFDIDAPHSFHSVLQHARIVVMCVETKGVELPRYCVEHGISYIDITASIDIIQSLHSLKQQALDNHCMIITSVGLAPGLTNLLAKHVLGLMPSVTNIDIFIQLGLGEIHGPAAMKWTFDTLNSTYQLKSRRQSVWVKSFTEKKTTSFPGLKDEKERPLYNFNFSDQHVISDTLNIEEAKTYFGFFSAFTTKLLAGSRKLGLTKILGKERIQTMLRALLKVLPMGSKKFRLQAVGWSRDFPGTKQVVGVQGSNEGYSTGLFTAWVVRQALLSTGTHGAFHVEQLYSLEDFMKDQSSTDHMFYFQRQNDNTGGV